MKQRFDHMHSLTLKLKDKAAKALERAFDKLNFHANIKIPDLDPQLVAASKPEFGDFQLNGALSLAKFLKKAPREIAMEISHQLSNDEEFMSICDPPQIAGPGFINITIKKETLIKEIKVRLNDKRLGINLIGNKLPIVVDFSSPNIAKEMHVGHLRSTIIGDCISRILEFRGYRVLRLNHVGDWGTQFGMLINHLKKKAPKALLEANQLELGDLVEFYREAKKRFDEDETFRKESREEVVKLQKHEKLSIKAWELLCEQSRNEFQKIYDRLDIRLMERGESFYNKYLVDVIKDLQELGLLIVDNGAKCVVLQGIKGKDGNPMPMIIQKSDGGFNYATTDLAAIRYRFNKPPNGDGAYRLIYVTDAGQANHFKGVFQIAKRAKWIPKGNKIEHVPFGLVQGDDGKKLKTRSGESVKLKELLDEAIARAKIDLEKRLIEENRQENEEFISNVSQKIGLAAVKYADLSQNRTTNYQFNFDRMLALQGNTAPYLLYALVRIQGIARKGGDLYANTEDLKFTAKQEWSLIRELLKFDEVIAEVEEELLPNRLCNYLFELSQMFNRFYDQVPVLKADSALIPSRLALCRLTAETLRLGMNLLGMPILERM